MRIAVAREIDPTENRVAATPETVKKMKGLGADVSVEPDAGTKSGIPDAEFAAASLWPAAITAVVVGIAAALSAGAAQRAPQARRPARRGYPTGRSARRSVWPQVERRGWEPVNSSPCPCLALPRCLEPRGAQDNEGTSDSAAAGDDGACAA